MDCSPLRSPRARAAAVSARRLLASLLWVFVAMLFLLLTPGRLAAQAQAETPSVELQYPNIPLNEILLLYEDLTGVNIIKDVNAIGASVSIETTGKLTRTKAAEFIEKTLLLNGYAFVPSGENLVKIISYGAGKQPRTEGVPIFGDVDDLPATDQVVNFFMPFTYISAEDAVRTFSQVMPNHSYGMVTAVPNASAVIITENSAVIRSLAELTEYVDVPPAKVDQISIQLLRADAEEVAGILAELLSATSQSGSSSSSSGSRAIPANIQQRTLAGLPGQPAAAQSLASLGGAAGVGGGVGSGPEPQILPIVRTNRILVIARPIDMAYIRALVEEFDAAGEVSNFLNRKLRYMSVVEFLPIASDALSRGQEQGAGGLGGLPGQGTTGRTTTTRTQFGGGGQTGGIGGGGGGGSSLGGAGVGLGDPQDLGGPQSLVIGKTLLIADGRANTLIVSGPPENLRVINELLDELDVFVPQIMISTVIGQMQLGDNLDWSIDVLRTLEDFEIDGTASRAAGLYRTGTGDAAAAIIDADGLDTLTDAFPILPGLSIYGKVGDYLNVFLRAVESTNRFTVLSRPSLFVRNNTKAVIQSGQRIAVPTTSLTTLSTGTADPSVTSNIEYRDVVLKLEVIPLINSDNEVTLQIAQLNDNVIGSQIVGGNEVPIIATQELVTEVTVPDQSTVVLGGLIQEGENETKQGFPWLMRIPVIKHLVGSHSEETTRNELLIFIQPHIISSQDDLLDANIDTSRRTAVAEPALDFALPPAPVEPTGVREDVDMPVDDSLFPQSTSPGDAGVNPGADPGVEDGGLQLRRRSAGPPSKRSGR